MMSSCLVCEKYSVLAIVLMLPGRSVQGLAFTLPTCCTTLDLSYHYLKQKNSIPVATTKPNGTFTKLCSASGMAF